MHVYLIIKFSFSPFAFFIWSRAQSFALIFTRERKWKVLANSNSPKVLSYLALIFCFTGMIGSRCFVHSHPRFIWMWPKRVSCISDQLWNPCQPTCLLKTGICCSSFWRRVVLSKNCQAHDALKLKFCHYLTKIFFTKYFLRPVSFYKIWSEVSAGKSSFEFEIMS